MLLQFVYYSFRRPIYLACVFYMILSNGTVRDKFHYEIWLRAILP